MWISSKRYEELWEEKRQLINDKNELIRALSGIVVAHGGKITIPLPSADHRSIKYGTTEAGMMEFEAKVFPLKQNKMSSE